MNMQTAGLLMAAAAQQVDMAPAMPASLTRWQWLQPAAEMAGITACLPLPVRQGRFADQVGYPRLATRTPSTGARAVTDARRFATTTLARWGVSDRTDDIAMVVSELVTNAFRHALSAPSAAFASSVAGRRRVRLGLLHTGSLMLCAVADPSDQLPVQRQPDELAETGRGLYVVEALADQWGYFAPGLAGKVVWATFSAATETGR
jgi:anti-sigma regulatory factor (Ser/Thr protein kinase)